jgi:hypothetical protein
MGKAVVLILGLPALFEGLWFAYQAQQQSCFRLLYGPGACGPALYVFTFLGIVFFCLTLWLERIWRD